MHMQVVDLFCGLGGFSAGAIAAGATVVMGVEHDSIPLKLWAANTPGSKAVIALLGPGGDAVELPVPCSTLHVHLSPPCTDLSSCCWKCRRRVGCLCETHSRTKVFRFRPVTSKIKRTDATAPHVFVRSRNRASRYALRML